MALIKCNNCGKEISDKAPKCIHCGCPIIAIKENSDYQTRKKIIVQSNNENIKKLIIFPLIQFVFGLIFCILTFTTQKYSLINDLNVFNITPILIFLILLLLFIYIVIFIIYLIRLIKSKIKEVIIIILTILYAIVSIVIGIILIEDIIYSIDAKKCNYIETYCIPIESGIDINTINAIYENFYNIVLKNKYDYETFRHNFTLVKNNNTNIDNDYYLIYYNSHHHIEEMRYRITIKNNQIERIYVSLLQTYLNSNSIDFIIYYNGEKNEDFYFLNDILFNFTINGYKEKIDSEIINREIKYDIIKVAWFDITYSPQDKIITSILEFSYNDYYGNIKGSETSYKVMLSLDYNNNILYSIEEQ